jgi:hypothetical protein
MTHSQTCTASTRAAERNALTVARAEERGLTFYGLLPESSEYWAESGIHTGDDLDRYLAYADWAESHKERRGYRARGYAWQDRTAAEWTAMSDELLATEAAW